MGEPEERDPFLASYLTLESAFSREDPGWLAERRRRAAEAYAERGLPGARDEAWKYTSAAPLRRIPFRRAGGEAGEATRGVAALAPGRLLALDPSPRLVFLDGRFRAELSRLEALPRGVRLLSLREALRSHGGLLEAHLGRLAAPEALPFAALSTALFGDGALVHLEAGVDLEEPVQIVLATSGQARDPLAVYPRLLIVAEEGARAVVVEDYLPASGRQPHGARLTNTVTEIAVGAGAAIDHVKVEREDPAAFHVGALAVRLESESRFHSHSISLGGRLVRNEIHAFLDGAGCDCALDGLVVAGERQHIDNTTRIVHREPHCSSRELYKAVLDGEAEGVFNGKIYVEKDAQKTDAKQTNQSLLLSEGAQLNSKPELEIYADDVKCTHGATVGQLDRQALFYLRARGIEEDRARGLLIWAFASDVISRIEPEPLRRVVEGLVFARLPGHEKLTEAR